MQPWCAEYLTTGEVARHCGVNKVTVLRWIRKRQLTAFRLPGGHYRISSRSFGEFLEKYEIPVRRSMVEKDDDVVSKAGVDK